MLQACSSSIPGRRVSSVNIIDCELKMIISDYFQSFHNYIVLNCDRPTPTFDLKFLRVQLITEHVRIGSKTIDGHRLRKPMELTAPYTDLTRYKNLVPCVTCRYKGQLNLSYNIPSSGPLWFSIYLTIGLVI